MNSITISGYIGKDAELRTMNNGDKVASFSVSDSQGKDKQPIWWRCSLFGKRAESLSQYLTTGQSVTVSGTVSEREYQNKEGVTVKSLDIRVNDVALHGRKQEDASGDQQPRPARVIQPAPSPAPRKDADFDNDIPF